MRDPNQELNGTAVVSSSGTYVLRNADIRAFHQTTMTVLADLIVKDIPIFLHDDRLTWLNDGKLVPVGGNLFEILSKFLKVPYLAKTGPDNHEIKLTPFTPPQGNFLHPLL